MVSITKDIRKYLQYQITAKARGYYDKSITTIFTEDNPSLDLGELTPYDGLKYTVDLSKNSVRPGEINFDGTVLPYVENNTLTKTNYCFGNSGTNYDLPVYEKIYSNITKVGDVSINNGIASNFSASNYLDLGNFDFSGDYEIVLKFKMPKTDSDTTYYKPFFDAKSNLYFNIAVTSYKNDNKRHIHSNSGNGSSWNTGIDGTTPLELNTEYYVKVVRSGTTRTMYLSTDNVTWSTEGSIEDTYNYSHSYCLGAASHLGSQEIFKGSFDLKESKITIGENIINLGDHSLQKQYTGYTTYGNAKVNNLVCSGFDSSSSSRVVLSNAKFNTSEPIYISFVMRADVSTRQKIFDTEDRLSFRVENGYFWYYKNENHTWIQWKSINANTGYKIKVTINSSSAYSIGLALINEGTYDYIDVTDTLNLTDGPVGIGNNLGGSYTQPFQGTIDISEIPGAYEVKTESKPGIFYNYEDAGSAAKLNCFSKSNEFVVLSPDENITDHTWLGKVNIPEHKISWNEPSVPATEGDTAIAFNNEVATQDLGSDIYVNSGQGINEYYYTAYPVNNSYKTNSTILATISKKSEDASGNTLLDFDRKEQSKEISLDVSTNQDDAEIILNNYEPTTVQFNINQDDVEFSSQSYNDGELPSSKYSLLNFKFNVDVTDDEVEIVVDGIKYKLGDLPVVANIESGYGVKVNKTGYKPYQTIGRKWYSNVININLETEE